MVIDGGIGNCDYWLRVLSMFLVVCLVVWVFYSLRWVIWYVWMCLGVCFSLVKIVSL